MFNLLKLPQKIFRIFWPTKQQRQNDLTHFWWQNYGSDLNYKRGLSKYNLYKLQQRVADKQRATKPNDE